MSSVLGRLEKYLNTAYSPDRECVDGEVVGRNVGERPHSRVLANLNVLLGSGSPHLFPWPGVRVKTIPGRRCRVPDMCVTLEDPGVDVFEAPPLICIEILSKKDRLSRIVAKCEEYAAFGVPYIWVLDPRQKKAFAFENGRLEEVLEALTDAAHTVYLPLDEIFHGV